MQALVIDDSRAIRLILARMLRELGLDVVEAANGDLALELIGAGFGPELILVDWNMPGISGIQFIAKVRHPPYASPARIVMITTETEVARVTEALAIGADEYLMKPFTKASVFEKLDLLGFSR